MNVLGVAEAQQYHVYILAALQRREGARAEHLMREHSYRTREHRRRLLPANSGRLTDAATMSNEQPNLLP